MLRPRWQKVISDITAHKVRSILVIASIAVGLFAIGLIVTIHQILAADLRTSYSKINPANIQVRAAIFDQEFVERISHIEGVKETSAAYQIDMRLKTAENEWHTIALKAFQDFDAPINQLLVVDGKFPPERKEIVLDKNKLADTNAKIGDFLEIKLPSGKIRKLRLVGIVHDQTIGSASGGSGFFLAPIQGYISNDSLEWLEQPDALNVLYATVAKQPNDLVHIRAIADEIVREFENNEYPTTSSVVRREIDHPNFIFIDAISAVLFVLGVLVVFLSAFLITNTLSALLNQQLEQIGVMKTFGGNRTQIVGIYMTLILVFSLIALALAIPLSTQASYVLLRFLSQQINFNLQGFRSVPLALILQTAVALVVPQLAGIIPILQGTNITIQEAISGVDSRHAEERPHGILKLLTKIRGVSRPLLISLRNTFRRRVRLVLTLLTLSLGGAIFISTFNVRTSLDQQVDRLGKYFIADVNLNFSHPYRISEIEREVKKVSHVKDIEGWAATKAELLGKDDKPGESLTLLGLPDNSPLIDPILTGGRWIKSGDQNALVVSELFFDHYPNLKLGDTIRLRVNSEKTRWVVVGFIQFAGKSSGMVAYTSYDYLSHLTNTSGKSASFRVVSENGYHDLKSQEALVIQLETLLNEKNYFISEIRAGQNLQESTTRGLNILTTFLFIMALLMASVGSIGLMGTMSLNVMERTREIGVMRAVGGSDKTIMGIVVIEGLLIGVLSWFFGCLAALPISKLMSDVISSIIFNSPGKFSYTASGFLIWLGLVVVLSLIASIIPARNAARLTIREVLAYE